MADIAVATSPEPSPSALSTQVLELSFGDKELVRRIKASKILLVGAGGIGCEVIKGLLLAGFERITIIDLDTIDVSNLNRQFLYNKSHVGQSKAKVAASVSVERFSHRDPKGCPISVVVPIHDSILNMNYNKEFYRQFTFVINALDNNTTRVHVNRMCLAADVPLVESASASYNGNVRLIKRGVTQCFECEPPKKDENTYASCTIRNTPSLPIHCIVWAKHLFAQLFGQSDEEDISPDVNDPNLLSAEDVDAAQNGAASEEANGDNSNQQIAQSQSTRQYVESTGYDPKALFEKIFYKDILYLKKMENLWTNRTAPRELIYEKVASGEAKFEDISSSSNGTDVSDNGENGNTNESSNSAPSNSVIRDQKMWSISECFQVFCSSLSKLKERLQTEQILEWDKDDDTAVDFTAAVSNFRSYCFSIPRKSKFEVKSLAGNIIPAISTTNTTVGGFIILQTIRLLSSILPERIWKDAETETTKLDSGKLESEANELNKNGFMVYISNQNRKNLSKIAGEPLLPPKSSCMACSTDVKEIVVALPLAKTTLGDFIEQVVKKKFKTIAPDVNVFGLNKMLWAAEDEEDVDDTIRAKLLSNYSFMTDNVCLLLKDLEQNFEVRLILRDLEFDPEENDGEFYKVLNQSEFDTLCDEMKNGEGKDEATNGNGDASTNNASVEIDIELDDDEPELIEDEEEPAVKKAKIPNDDDFEMIEMSELNEIQVESTKQANQSSNKRPIDGEEGDVVELDLDGENGVQNGKSLNNTPNKRVRTN